jgi:hypothetical protein
MSHYEIAVCQPYNASIHGETEDSNENINYHFMIENTIDLDDFYENLYYIRIDIILEVRLRRSIINLSHPVIRNYEYIMNNKKVYPSVEIVEPIELSTGEYVACIKTFWLKLFQRKWKKIFKERKKKLNHYKVLTNLLNRERFGK